MREGQADRNDAAHDERVGQIEHRREASHVHVVDDVAKAEASDEVGQGPPEQEPKAEREDRVPRAGAREPDQTGGQEQSGRDGNGVGAAAKETKGNAGVVEVNDRDRPEINRLIGADHTVDESLGQRFGSHRADHDGHEQEPVMPRCPRPGRDRKQSGRAGFSQAAHRVRRDGGKTKVIYDNRVVMLPAAPESSRTLSGNLGLRLRADELEERPEMSRVDIDRPRQGEEEQDTREAKRSCNEAPSAKERRQFRLGIEQALDAS